MTEKPKLKGQSQKSQASNQPVQRGKSARGGGNGGNNLPPSPWLNPDKEPNPHATASFVEYLRWMRSPDGEYKEAAKNQILQMATEGRNYEEQLKKRNERTKIITQARQGECLQVMCPWRIRVGRHRRPESILLPSFDPVGIPYIPSSTLRGVARTAAIREFMNKGKSWNDAEKLIAKYFGSIEDPDKSNQSGKVVFLDAYPLATKSSGVAMDMANSGNPQIRGCVITPYSSDSFWHLPENPKEFKAVFTKNLIAFYTILGQLILPEAKKCWRSHPRWLAGNC